MSREPLFGGNSQAPAFSNVGQANDSFNTLRVGQFWLGLEWVLSEPVRPQLAGCKRTQLDFLGTATAAIKAFLTNRLERGQILFC